MHLSPPPTQQLGKIIKAEAFANAKPITRERVIARGNEILRPKSQTFVIEPHLEEAVERLIRRYNPSLQFPTKEKNFILFGNTGSGKSLLLKIFNDLANDWQRARIIETQTIALMFAKSGWTGDEMNRLLNQKLNHSLPNNYAFEDIGREDHVIHVANNIPRSKMTNTFVQVYHHRNLMWETHDIHNHGTTNLSEDELLAMYDQRTFSRIKGSTEFIPCGTKADDRDFRIKPELITATA